MTTSAFNQGQSGCRGQRTKAVMIDWENQFSRLIRELFPRHKNGLSNASPQFKMLFKGNLYHSFEIFETVFQPLCRPQAPLRQRGNPIKYHHRMWS